MSTTFLWADTHFGHHGTACLFKRDDGTPLRPFASVEEQDETLIANYNSVVRPGDKCYFLGDVTMNTKNLAKIMPRLNGKKTLVRGNHDIGKAKDYLKWFGEIHACRILAGVVLTHIPIHPDSIRRWEGNIHGHMHFRKVDDPRYLCVSVEQINYTPIALEEAVKRLKNQKDTATTCEAT